jgi:hypothetical protein
MSGEFLGSGLPCVSSAEAKPCGHKFTDDRDVEATVTGLLVARERDFHKHGTEQHVVRCDRCVSIG